MPQQVLENWHEFVGNTNVIDVTEKSGTGTALLGAETGGQAMKKFHRRRYKLTSIFSYLAKSLGDLLPPARYPVKALFGAAPQIARNSGTHPRPIPQT
jgi:hypothetical protein